MPANVTVYMIPVTVTGVGKAHILKGGRIYVVI